MRVFTSRLPEPDLQLGEMDAYGSEQPYNLKLLQTLGNDLFPTSSVLPNFIAERPSSSSYNIMRDTLREVKTTPGTRETTNHGVMYPMDFNFSAMSGLSRSLCVPSPLDQL